MSNINLFAMIHNVTRIENNSYSFELYDFHTCQDVLEHDFFRVLNQRFII